MLLERQCAYCCGSFHLFQVFGWHNDIYESIVVVLGLSRGNECLLMSFWHWHFRSLALSKDTHLGTHKYTRLLESLYAVVLGKCPS